MAGFVVRVVMCAVGYLSLLFAVYAISPPVCGYLLFASCVAALIFDIRVLIDVHKSNQQYNQKGKAHV